MSEEFTRSYKSGEIIFSEGEDGHFACLLREGLVEIFRDSGSARAQIAEVHPGQIFGELSLVDGGKRMASARALVGSRVFLLDEKYFKGKLDELPASQRKSFQRLIDFVRDTLPYGVVKPGDEGAGDPVLMEEMGTFVEGAEFAHAMARDGDAFLQSLADLLIYYAKRRMPPR